jgi:hypothetical protein
MEKAADGKERSDNNEMELPDNSWKDDISDHIELASASYGIARMVSVVQCYPI